MGRETLWDEMIASRGADDLAILVYTSGTTGPPKGAMHSNRSVTHQMRHANDLFPSTDAEERLVFLPLCHVAERVGGYYISLALGSVMNFAESPETVPDNLREVQPTAFLAVPRIWEKFYSGITIALKDATPFQNWMYRRALAIGYRMTDCRLRARRPRCRCVSPTRPPTGWCSATSAACWGWIVAASPSPVPRRSRRN